MSYFSKRTGKKRQYLQILRSYRDEQGKSRHSVICTLGRVDVLLKKGFLQRMTKQLIQLCRYNGYSPMKIGACGMCCDTCALYKLNICQGCAAGNTLEATKKLEFLRNLNVRCPILECAVQKNIAFCFKDCKKFPCKKIKEHRLYCGTYFKLTKER